MTKIIVNGDDFGATKGVNRGIIEAYKNGILRSATMLVNGTEVNDAVALAKNLENFSLGIHLALTIGKPILTDLKNIVDENGNFHKLKKLMENPELIDITEVEREWRAQLSQFIKIVGDKPTHIDSHHHVHVEDMFKGKIVEIKRLVNKLMDEYNLPVRAYDNTKVGCKSPKLDSDFYQDNIREDYFASRLNNIKSNEITEFMAHPAFIDKDLMEISSYNLIRMEELDVLTSNEVKKLFEEENIEIISYLDIKNN